MHLHLHLRFRLRMHLYLYLHVRTELISIMVRHARVQKALGVPASTPRGFLRREAQRRKA
jgi:hypothetical protein